MPAGCVLALSLARSLYRRLRRRGSIRCGRSPTSGVKRGRWRLVRLLATRRGERRAGAAGISSVGASYHGVATRRLKTKAPLPAVPHGGRGRGRRYHTAGAVERRWCVGSPGSVALQRRIARPTRFLLGFEDAGFRTGPYQIAPELLEMVIDKKFITAESVPLKVPGQELRYRMLSVPPRQVWFRAT